MTKVYIKKEWKKPSFGIESRDLGAEFFAPNLSPDNNLTVNVSDEEYYQVLSALLLGADIIYPDLSDKLISIWLQASLQPMATLVETVGDCIDYPLYAPWISWLPFNPFNPDESPPSGYSSPPFVIHDGGSSMPPAYVAGDVLVPFEAINPVDYTVFGQPITIAVELVGSGQVELDLLAVVQGGVAVLKVGANPPNAFDIIGGVIDPETETIIDLSLDQSQSPPSDDIVSAQEINITQNVGESTTLWIQFLPVVDFDFIPLKFGGGIRAIQLCGFEVGSMSMGVTDVRQTGDKLEKFENGVWVEFADMLSEAEVEPIIAASPTIVNINNDIATNTGNITTNADDIAAESARIDTNIIAIGDNTIDIADLQADVAGHETRITALENTPVGTPELTTTTQKAIVRRQIFADALLSDFTTWDVNIPQTHNHIVIRINATNTTGGKTNLAMYKNDDFTNSNYQWLRSSGQAGAVPVISNLANNTGGGNVEQFVEVEIVGVLQSNKQMGVTRSGISGNSTNISGDAYHGAWFCEVAGAITKLSFRSSVGDIQAGSSLQIFAIEEIDVITSAELENEPDPVPVAWDATIRFWDLPSIPSFVTSNDFTRAGNGSYEADTVGPDFTGLFTIDAGSVGRFDTVSFQYFHLTGGVPDQSELWVGDFAQLLTFQLQDGTNTTPDFVFTEVNSQTIQFTVNWYGLGASGEFQLGQIKLSGSGAIPSNLAPYGQEYF